VEESFRVKKRNTVPRNVSIKPEVIMQIRTKKLYTLANIVEKNSLTGNIVIKYIALANVRIQALPSVQNHL